MRAALTAVAGPLQGTTFLLDEGEFLIGREEGNAICLDDIHASRRHCRITYSSEEYSLEDLGSRNGTHINGLPVSRRVLRQGDYVAIGDSLFLFSNRQEELASIDSVQLERARLQTQTDVLASDSQITGPEERRDPAKQSAADEIAAADTTSALERQIVGLLLSALPADRVALLAEHIGGVQFGVHCGVDRNGHLPVRVKESIIEQVIRQRQGVIRSDRPAGAGAFKSILCVPYITDNTVDALLYLETDPPRMFNQEHLRIANALAEVVGTMLSQSKALRAMARERERKLARDQLDHQMVGNSRAMQMVYEFIARVSPTDASILLQGESGTGKELIARALHFNSPRARHAFIAVNCAALTDTLLESELFGHEKGAFTGAVQQTKGLFEAADGGSLFLDEISELALPLQSKLLRALDGKGFNRVGGTRTIDVDVRIIAATNADLEARVRAQTFRSDLFFRLNVVSLKVPPLREHREDIPLLANHFLRRFSRRFNARVQLISPEAQECLAACDWPGNVRELENAIERSVVLAASEVIRPEDLPEGVAEIRGATGDRGRYQSTLRNAKRELVLSALRQANGDINAAAGELGIHPNYLRRLLRTLDIKSEAIAAGRVSR